MVSLLLNKTSLVLLMATTLFAKSINYGVSDIHTLTMPKNNVHLSASYMLMNDSIDLLNIKKSELGGNSNFNALGDIDGYEIGVAYGLRDDLMISYKFNQQNIVFNNNKFENIKNEIFVRYNLFQNASAVFNSGISLDAGFINNNLKNIYITDIDDINEFSKRYSNGDFQIVPNNNGGLDLVHYNQSTTLEYYPWIGIEDSSDNSLYLRALTGFHNDSGLYDFFIGMKYTKINNKTTANSELLSLASKNNYNVEKDLQRNETMYFLGTNISCEISDFILEFTYEFDYFQRDKNLDYINFNHIADVTLDYKVSKNLLIFAGSKFMYRQLNGQIPYLYNQYTQTTYDHTYGYAKLGITYNFKFDGN